MRYCHKIRKIHAKKETGLRTVKSVIGMVLEQNLPKRQDMPNIEDPKSVEIFLIQPAKRKLIPTFNILMVLKVG